jgi:endo-1,4-beta-xylanase
MKLHRSLVSFLVVNAILGIAAGADSSKEKVSWNHPADFTEPGLTHHQFASAAMKREVGYSVWVPPGYALSPERYPVVYFLHGSGGTESADAPAFSHMLAERLAAKKIPPVICVFPNGGLSGYRDHPEIGVNVETMIIRELVPLIDRSYRTRMDRDSRVLAGFSMGGGGAVRLALKYSDLFSAAASWAGALSPHNDGEKAGSAFDDGILDPSRPHVRLLMIVGYKDLTWPWHAPALAALEAARYPFTLHTIADLGHELGRYYELTGDELIEFVTAGFGRSK